MERWKKWLSFNFKKSFLRPSRAILLKVISRLRHKSKGKLKSFANQKRCECVGLSASVSFPNIMMVAEKGTGMVSLYKDKEACAEYADIQVMWDMVHSSIYTNSPQTRKMPFHRRVGFRLT